MRRGHRERFMQASPRISPHRLRVQNRELAYLQSGELVTPCRLVLVFLCSVVMVLLISLSATDTEFQYESILGDQDTVNISRKPYVFDYKSMQQIREDLMSYYGYQKMGGKVDKRSELTVNEFFDLYDGKWPVIVTDIIPNWTAYKSWSKELFIDKYGTERIVLKAVQGQLQDGVAYIRDFRTFIGYLDQASSPEAWTYMEDEMFLMLHPELKADIGANYLMDENFFNLFPSEIRPWDSMMLWGTKYSRSTLHMDPYNWTAISAVIWGRKRWKLFPPGQDRYLYIEPNNRCGFPLECVKYDSVRGFCCSHNWSGCLTERFRESRWSSSGDRCSKVDAFNPDYWRYPKFRKAEYIEVEQTSGELLIIPSGWYHQAFNDEQTLSVSMQVMNRNNYLSVLEEIIKGKNLSRKKLPPNFNTLLPPDQVKLFMSLIPKKILKNGQQVTDSILGNMDLMQKHQDMDSPIEGDNSSKEIGDNSSKEIGDNFSKEIGDNSSKEIGDNSSKEIGDNSSKEMGDNSSKEIGDNSSKEIV